jgi:hypothetical protein
VCSFGDAPQNFWASIGSRIADWLAAWLAGPLLFDLSRGLSAKGLRLAVSRGPSDLSLPVHPFQGFKSWPVCGQREVLGRLKRWTLEWMSSKRSRGPIRMCCAWREQSCLVTPKCCVPVPFLPARLCRASGRDEERSAPSCAVPGEVIAGRWVSA